MKINKLLTCLLFISSFGQLFSQSSDFETILTRGISDYETGRYENALSWFTQAFKLKRESNKACYYLSLAHLALENNEEAATYSAKVIKRGGKYSEDAYLVNATVWANLGRNKKARRIYNQALKKYPTNYLIYYNLAFSLHNDKNFEKAQEYATMSIELHPAHASSHLLLAYIMYAQGERVQSMLPLYYFLLLEPESDRSKAAYELLTNLWNQGIRQKGQRDIQLVAAGFHYDDFAQTELSISLIKAAKNIQNERNEAPTSRNNLLVEFAQNNNAFFTILEEASDNKDGFWWDFYVNFFSKLKKNNLNEPFSYYISASRYNDDVLLWMSANMAQFKRFTSWMENQ
ncbi:Tetratricopeptide repeat-containing protein [Saccharicrinis carchari]|uniref:Tetratricopeptide repeat-containing protein n=1 Tax=Saccharicrinis carchari TaxID=1168039 RepID=A0A521E763_SACCC|nr:tetratricopeptide repeat protein [Saccharicrinis carchari]SMO79702.1 Tetratricopeptide repeat-containing protein [Saccharicrinis carchari]